MATASRQKLLARVQEFPSSVTDRQQSNGEQSVAGRPQHQWLANLHLWEWLQCFHVSDDSPRFGRRASSPRSDATRSQHSDDQPRNGFGTPPTLAVRGNKKCVSKLRRRTHLSSVWAVPWWRLHSHHLQRSVAASQHCCFWAVPRALRIEYADAVQPIFKGIVHMMHHERGIQKNRKAGCPTFGRCFVKKLWPFENCIQVDNKIRTWHVC